MIKYYDYASDRYSCRHFYIAHAWSADKCYVIYLIFRVVRILESGVLRNIVKDCNYL